MKTASTDECNLVGEVMTRIIHELTRPDGAIEARTEEPERKKA
jgi:hypothetical protein